MIDFNKVWRRAKVAGLSRHVVSRDQLPFVAKVLRLPIDIAKGLLGRHAALEGAGSNWESVIPLYSTNASPLSTATTGGTRVFPLFDFASVLEIGAMWTTAGTGTALTVDFNLAPNADGSGTSVSRLNGTAGFITSPSTAQQTVGRVLAKEIANTVLIDVRKGQSIVASIAVAATGGAIIPYVLVIPRAEMNANLPTAVVSL